VTLCLSYCCLLILCLLYLEYDRPLFSPPPGEPVRWRSSHLLPFVPADKRKTGRSGFHASPRRELPDVHGRQEVHHRHVIYLHGQQLRHLCSPASASFPARCFSHLLPELPLLVFPPAAVMEEMLQCLAHHSPAPPALVILSVSESFLVSSGRRMPAL